MYVGVSRCVCARVCVYACEATPIIRRIYEAEKRFKRHRRLLRSQSCALFSNNVVFRTVS